MTAAELLIILLKFVFKNDQCNYKAITINMTK